MFFCIFDLPNFDAMNELAKSKIYQLLETIQDESILKQVMEDVAFYASKADSVDHLTKGQLKELDAAISEADLGKTISWDSYKKDLDEWRKK